MLDLGFFIIFNIAGKYVIYANGKQEWSKYTNMLIIVGPWIYSGLLKLTMEGTTNIIVTIERHSTNYVISILRNRVDLPLGENLLEQN
jgi:hypothetical protein